MQGKVLENDCYDAEIFMVAWAQLYRRSFMEKNNLSEVCKLRCMEDVIFNLYCFEYAKKIVYKNLYLYNYRKRAKSISNQ